MAARTDGARKNEQPAHRIAERAGNVVLSRARRRSNDLRHRRRGVHGRITTVIPSDPERSEGESRDPRQDGGVFSSAYGGPSTALAGARSARDDNLSGRGARARAPARGARREG